MLSCSLVPYLSSFQEMKFSRAGLPSPSLLNKQVGVLLCIPDTVYSEVQNFERAWMEMGGFSDVQD